ncbi:MAG: serine protease, partial [Planctomycetaceae bacterium]|nr:serine protease [Planctomycetaceae bacterium]
MKLHRQTAWLLTCLLIASLFVLPDNLIDAQEVQTAKTVEQLAANIKPSLVTISTKGRDGKYQGVGTGFVVDQEGLIVTNLHVIGDSREFRVETASGEELKVIGIHASDRVMDLAIIRVQASDLTALAMGDINSLAQGAPIIVMGNPHGLRNSVVSGINSGIREIDGRKMMQLAIPIEPGNSGGPVLDMQGNVHGIVTMKSLVTANLGFAVDIAPLKALLDSPNPVTIEKWLTIGSLDPRDWEPVFGPHWKQRGGRILAGGSGAGFAGRSL